MVYTKMVMDFFSDKSDFYLNYLNSTGQKEASAREIASKMGSKSPIDVLVVGGGSGEGDLNVIGRLNNVNSISYVDPSETMFSIFKENMKNRGLGLSSWSLKEFESGNYSPPESDLILCINSVYFLEGWKEKNDRNPLLKLFSTLKDNGSCVIVIKSDDSDHCVLKKIAGGGTSTGKILRDVLSEMKIPYIMETCESSIDMSSCFEEKGFKPNENGVKLLTFMLGGRWESLEEEKKSKLISELKKRVKWIGNKPMLGTKYEHIWIRKVPVVKKHVEEKSMLEVVDDNDKIIGRDERSKIHKEGILHREAAAFIFNNKGQIMLPVRFVDKKFDFSVSGHPRPGETYADAMAREAKEELSMDLDKSELKPLLKFRMCSRYPGRVNDKFVQIFAVKKKIMPPEIVFDTNEVVALESFELEDLVKLKEEDVGKAFASCLKNDDFIRKVMEYGRGISKN